MIVHRIVAEDGEGEVYFAKTGSGRFVIELYVRRDDGIRVQFTELSEAGALELRNAIELAVGQDWVESVRAPASCKKTAEHGEINTFRKEVTMGDYSMIQCFHELTYFDTKIPDEDGDSMRVFVKTEAWWSAGLEIGVIRVSTNCPGCETFEGVRLRVSEANCIREAISAHDGFIGRVQEK